MNITLTNDDGSVVEYAPVAPIVASVDGMTQGEVTVEPANVYIETGMPVVPETPADPVPEAPIA